MSETEKKSIPELPASREVTFAFMKTGSFRTIYVMGSWGRINADQDIILSLLREVEPLPISVTQEIQANGTWNPEPKFEMPPKYQIVREVEVDVVLPLEAAKRVYQNLGHFISIVEERKKQQANQSQVK